MITEAGAFASALCGSQTPKTTSTRMNPKKNSIPNPCTGDKPSWTLVLPKPRSEALGISA